MELEASSGWAQEQAPRMALRKGAIRGQVGVIAALSRLARLIASLPYACACLLLRKLTLSMLLPAESGVRTARSTQIPQLASHQLTGLHCL